MAIRWRLSKKDPAAAISEPVEPIVYYLDRGAPEPFLFLPKRLELLPAQVAGLPRFLRQDPAARDIYYGCLDKHDILDSIAEKEKAAKVCAVEGRGFEANCASSWVRKSWNVPRIWYMCMGNIELTIL